MATTGTTKSGRKPATKSGRKPAAARETTPREPRKSAAAKKVEKAAAEVAAEVAENANAENDTKRIVEWSDLKLEVPSELPAEVLFDFVEMEAEGFSPMPMLRVVRSLVGPEAFIEIRTRVAAADSSLSATFDAINTILDGYGMSLGESAASAPS